MEFAKDAQNSIEKKITDKSVSPSTVSKKSAKSVKENNGNVDPDKIEDLCGKSDKNEGIPRKETLLSGEGIETKVLFNNFTNVQLNSQEGEQG